ncbi:MAG: right-handed parallel beta-helix repeat-containing protein [Sedimentisphaerales bacterium]|nr:right-handed parallel beta-helix repeat-containing protein [Sedimentisphaerales bacterium]
MKGNRQLKAATAICVLSLTLSLRGVARTIYVDEDRPADFSTIQAAIDDANDGDAVIICPGTYTGPGNRDIDFKGKAITVQGTDPNDPDVVRRTAVDCQGTQEEPHRGFLFASGEGPNSVLSGLTITNGYAPRISLEIYKEYVGGGICCNESSPSIIRCIISENLARHGGGGFFAYNGEPALHDCEFRSNINVSVGAGAIEFWRGQLTVTDCIIIGNYGDQCGGVSCEWASALVLENCLISRNEGQYDTAGVRIEGKVDAAILNCTIIDNRGRGVYVANSSRSVRLTNCIVWGNSSGGTCNQDTQIGRYSGICADYCCVDGWDGTLAGVGSFGNDPLLTRDTRLGPGSPCIDTGDPNLGGSPTTRDIDGEARFYGPRVDIGCDEFIDEDGDNLADVWERLYFGDLTIADATGNPDGDPWDNESEYIRGSNPLHPPTTYYIDPVRGNDGWDGLTVSRDGEHGPKATIRAAMNRAEAHDLDRIVLLPGTYAGEGNRNIDFDGKEVTICSVDPNDPAVVAATIIDCGGVHPIEIDPRVWTPGPAVAWDRLTSTILFRAFVLRSGEGADAGIEGITIVSGAADGDGGAILCEWSSPRIRNCIFRNNESAMRGGAISCRSGSAAIEWCTMEQNRACYGAAIACSSVDGHTCITNCTIRANTAVSSGGGVSCGSATQMVGCLIAMNESQGLGNTLGRYLCGGGGVMVEGIGAVLANCTIAGNIAEQGSGLASGCVDGGEGIASLYNCIVWGNSGGQENQVGFSWCCPGCVRTTGPVAIRARRSCIQGGAGLPLSNDGMYLAYVEDANCVHSDPHFVSPETGDYRLEADSPCIDVESGELPVQLASTDLDGTARNVDFDGDGVAQTDMGTYEALPSDGTFVVPSQWTMQFRVYDSSPLAELQTLTIRSRGADDVQWVLDCNCPWLEVSPTSGPTGTEITLRVDATGLTPGTYECRPVIHASCAANSPISILVELQVGRTLRVPESHATIQAAVDAAESGDMILLADGVYTGSGNRGVMFPAKSLWIRGEHGPQDCVIDCESTETESASGFFVLRPGSEIVLEGLTITRASFGIRVYGSRVTFCRCDVIDCESGCEVHASRLIIEKCRFNNDNAAVGGYACDVEVLDSEVAHNASEISLRSSQVVIDHCLIAGNGSTAMTFSDTQPIIRNCTVVGNVNRWDNRMSPTVPVDTANDGQVVNSIFWNNRDVAESLLPRCAVRFSNIQGGWLGEGNFDSDPGFVSDGYWDVGASRSGALWIDGDYHLKSQAGRWEAGSQTWVIDDITSPCIDAGDPNSPVRDEPEPNGGRINLGAYGGTTEASKSHSGP